MIDRVRELFDAVDVSEDEDTTAARILLVVTGALVIQMAFRVWAGLLPGSIPGVIAILILMVTGVQLWIFSASNLDMDKWGRAVGYGTLLAVAAAAAVALFWTGSEWLPPLTTDESAFLHYSAQLALNGQNPYAHSMLPALDLPGSVNWATPRIDGQLSDRMIYPSLSFLVFVPFVASGVEIATAAWAAALGIGLISIAALPPRWGIVPTVALLSTRNIVLLGAIGDFDAIWLLPFVAAFILRADKRWLAAGLAMGLACSVKQIPWLAVPFLAIQHARLGRKEALGFLKAGVIGGGVFAATNGPFIIAAPGLWARNVITPLGQTLPKVSTGVGPTLLTYSGLFPVATSWHTVALVCVAAAMAVAVFLYPDTFGPAVWLTPVPLLFVRSRSFASYFGTLTIIAALGVFAASGELHARWPAIRDLWRPIRRPDNVEVTGDD